MSSWFRVLYSLFQIHFYYVLSFYLILISVYFVSTSKMLSLSLILPQYINKVKSVLTLGNSLNIHLLNTFFYVKHFLPSTDWGFRNYSDMLIPLKEDIGRSSFVALSKMENQGVSWEYSA